MAWTYALHDLAAAIGVEALKDNPAFSAVSTDSRSMPPKAVFFALSGERFDGNNFVPQAFEKGAVAAVTSRPCEGGPCLVVENVLAALQQFAAWHRRRFDIPIIAITGSCGKTSTKDFTAALLSTRYRVVKTQGNLNNDIGCPLSLLQIDDATEAAIIEMGANHMGEIASLCAIAQPTESMITMVAPSHLEGFGSIANIAKAKGEIAEALPPDGVFYVNADDNWCIRIAEAYEGRKVRVGTQGDVRIEACEFAEDGLLELRIAPVGTLRLPLLCRAHAMNVALAVAVGLEHGIGLRHGECDNPRYYEEPLQAACAKASRFKAVSINNLLILDDSYNANPASMTAALETLSERPASRRFAVLGDMLELGPTAESLHRDMGTLAGELGIDHVYARGEFAQAVVEAAQQAGALDARVIQDHEDMARTVAETAPSNSVVLVKGSRGMQMERVITALQNAPESTSELR